MKAARRKKQLLRVAAVIGAAILCLLGSLVFAAGVSQKRLDCFDALAGRQAPLSDYTFFLGQPEEYQGPGFTCYRYDTYLGVLKLACLEETGQVVSGGGEYNSCGASLPVLIRHSYKIIWRVAVSAEERRILRCDGF